MRGRCVTAYKRIIWYAINCERWYGFPTSTLNIKFFDSKSEAEKQSKNVGSITISATPDIHVRELDENV